MIHKNSSLQFVETFLSNFFLLGTVVQDPQGFDLIRYGMFKNKSISGLKTQFLYEKALSKSKKGSERCANDKTLKTLLKTNSFGFKEACLKFQAC